MFKYAQVDENFIVHSVCILSGEIVDDNSIPIDMYDESLVGKKYNSHTGEFEEVSNAAD